MAELIDAFLAEVQAGLETLEQSLGRLESNPAEEKIWADMTDFFELVRSCAPFAAFPRSYKLSTAALDEIRAYKSGHRQIDVLPQILMKLQRLKKIMTSGITLKREPRESDADLLPPAVAKVPKGTAEKTATAMLQTAQLLSLKEKKILQQEKALDEREEQLVQWAQTLFDQENDLKRRENFIFEDEKKSVNAQTKIAASLTDIQKREAKMEEKLQFLQTQEKSIRDAQNFWENQGRNIKELKRDMQALLREKQEKENEIAKKEKLLADLEEELAAHRVNAERAHEQLKERERQQEESRTLLENKNRALREMTEELCRLEEELFKKSECGSKLESELRLEVQQTRQQLRDSENALQTLQLQYARSEEAACKSGTEYAALRAEYDEVLEHFTESQTAVNQILEEKSDLERQCTEVNKQLALLQDEIFAKTEQLKQTKNILENHKRASEKLQAELRAAGWPFNAEKIQENFARILLERGLKQTTDSLVFMKDLIHKIRSKPLSEAFIFLQKFIVGRAKKYDKVYSFSFEAPNIDIDQDAFSALEQILVALADNALRYVILGEEDKAVELSVSVVPDGAFLKVVFSDNTAVFPFEKIRGAVVEAGLETPEAAAELTYEQLLRFLFHSRVMRQTQTRGLAEVARLLERSGGQIKAWVDRGLNIAFSLPRDFIFDKVLVFSVADHKYAVPLNMVAETFSLNPQEIGEKGTEKVFCRKGQPLPVLNLPNTEETQTPFGIVLQAGVFNFLLPVQKIAEAEQFVSFLPEQASEETPYLKPCVTLESALVADWIDISFLLNLCPLGLSENAAPLCAAKTEPVRPAAATTAYLIYHSDPQTFGAVAVDRVLRIEAFDGVQIDGMTGKPVFIADGQKLPLKDSSSKKNFPYAQTVLLFQDYALAIQDVADIVDAPAEQTDNLLYQGHKVPVLPL